MDYSNAFILKLKSGSDSLNFCDFSSYSVSKSLNEKIDGVSEVLSMKPIQEISTVKKKNQVTATFPLNIYSKPFSNSLFVQGTYWDLSPQSQPVNHGFKVLHYIELSKSFPVNICFQLFNNDWSPTLNSGIPVIDHNTHFKSKIPNLKSKQIEEFRQTQIDLVYLGSDLNNGLFEFLLLLLFKTHFFILKISFLRKIIEGKELITDYSCSELKSVCDCSFDGFILQSLPENKLVIHLISLDLKIVSFIYDATFKFLANEAGKANQQSENSSVVSTTSTANCIKPISQQSSGLSQIKLKKNKNCLVYYPFVGYADELSTKKCESKKAEKVSIYAISCFAGISTDISDMRITPYCSFANNFNENRIYRLFSLKQKNTNKVSLFALSMTVATEMNQEHNFSKNIITVRDVVHKSNFIQIEMMINKELDLSFKTVDETEDCAIIAMTIEKQGLYLFHITGTPFQIPKSDYFQESFKSQGAQLQAGSSSLEDSTESIFSINLSKIMYVQADVSKMCTGFSVNSKNESIIAIFNNTSQRIEVLNLNVMQFMDSLVLTKDTLVSEKFVTQENLLLKNSKHRHPHSENNLADSKSSQNVNECLNDKYSNIKDLEVNPTKSLGNFNMMIGADLEKEKIESKPALSVALNEFDMILNNRLGQLKTVLREIEEDLESTRTKNNENLKNISKTLSNLAEQTSNTNRTHHLTGLHSKGAYNFMPVNSFGYNNHHLVMNHNNSSQYGDVKHSGPDSQAFQHLINQNLNLNMLNGNPDIYKRYLKKDSGIKSSVASSSNYAKSRKINVDRYNPDEATFSPSSTRTENESILEMSSFMIGEKSQSALRKKDSKTLDKKGKKKKTKGITKAS